MKGISLINSKLSVIILLIFLLIVTYFNALNNPFHFDDFHHVRDNPVIKDVKNIPYFFIDVSAFSGDSVTGHYRPLLLATHAINYAIGGLNPIGYHIVNLAFHAGTAFLIFLIVQAILGTPPPILPLASALIFAVHPFNSEVVNYISARSSVMSAFFFLLAFYCWVRFRSQKSEVRSQKVSSNFLPLTSYFYITSLLTFLLGLLTKEIVITLPIVLWLYDLYFVSRAEGDKKFDLVNRLKRLYVYLPFLFLVALPYILLRAYLTTAMLSPTEPPRGYYVNLLTQTKTLIRYIQIMLLPVALNVEHYIAEAYSILNWQVISSAFLLLSVFGISIWLYFCRTILLRFVSFFILWFFIVLLPTTIIPLEVILQENRGYLAAVSFAVVSGSVLGKGSSFKSSGKWISVILLVLILGAYSVSTMQRNRLWQDDVALWSDSVQKSPLLARPHHNLAVSYRQKGDFAAAIVEYRRAIELAPNRREPYYALGNIYRMMNLLDLAVAEYRKAVEIDPAFYRAYNNLGLTYWKMGDLNMAIMQFEKALDINKDYSLSRLNLGRIYAQMGQTDRALREFETVRRNALSTPGEERYASDAIEYMEQLGRKIK